MESLASRTTSAALQLREACPERSRRAQNDIHQCWKKMSEPTTTLRHETADRTPELPATQAAAPVTPALTPTSKDSAEGRKLIRNLVGLLVVFGAVFLTLYVWSVLAR